MNHQLLYTCIFIFLISIVLSIIIFVSQKNNDKAAKSMKYTLLLTIFVGLFSASMFYLYNKSDKVNDTEIISGKVASKNKTVVSCSHSYECNCKMVKHGSGQNIHYTRECSTCYEHNHDYDWTVQTTAGNFMVPRIDRQGNQEPPRFSQVMVGEPVAFEHSYDNWIKGAKSSLFNRNGEETGKFQIPPYPSVYDYYRIHRIVSDAPNVLGNVALAEDLLAKSLSTLGPDKQVNVSIFHSVDKPETYARAIYNAFNGGKKNDVMVVISTNNKGDIQWVRVTSYSSSDIVNVKIRDDIKNIGNVKNMDTIANVIINNISTSFVRTSMKTYRYLEADIDYFPTWNIVVIVILQLISSAFIYYKAIDK